MDERKHYYLVAGEVTFRQEGDEEDMAGVTRLNGIVSWPDQKLTSSFLGRCQQVLQLNLHARFAKQTEIPPPQVANVVIQSLTYLGQYTQAEFNEENVRG